MQNFLRLFFFFCLSLTSTTCISTDFDMILTMLFMAVGSIESCQVVVLTFSKLLSCVNYLKSKLFRFRSLFLKSICCISYKMFKIYTYNPSNSQISRTNSSHSDVPRRVTRRRLYSLKLFARLRRRRRSDHIRCYQSQSVGCKWH